MRPEDDGNTFETFVQETQEHLDKLEDALASLQTDPGDRAALERILRLFHTLKGTIGFFDLKATEKLAHATEGLLKSILDQTCIDTEAALKIVLRTLDLVRDLFDSFRRGQDERLFKEAFEDLEADIKTLTAIEEKRLKAQKDNKPQIMRGGWPVAAEFLKESAALEQQQRIKNAPQANAAPAAEPEAPSLPPPAADVLQQGRRIDESLLEHMTDLTTDLVLTRNQLLKKLKGTEAADLLNRLSEITAALQQTVMKTRMVPIHNLWKRFGRLIRQLSRQFGKNISLSYRNEQTEVDGQILEILYDPFVHIVRNACDHGIELPDERWAAGKSKDGHIRFDAFYENGLLTVQIANDGRPLDTEAIGKKALALGLLSPEELAKSSPEAIHKFIFYPGFSTARKITNVSGRGVGMDVVRTALNQLDGTVEIRSSKEGVCLTLRIPTSLSIQTALGVGAGEGRFFIPHMAIEDIYPLNLQSESGHNAPLLSRSEDSLFAYLREEILPTLCLGALLDPARKDLHLRTALTQPMFFLTLHYGQKRFGLVVERLEDPEEISIRPLPSLLRPLSLYAGTTLLGDGTISLILNVAQMARNVGFSEVDFDIPTHSRTPEVPDDSLEVLLVDHTDQNRLALPLSLVDSLEQLAVKDIQTVDNRLAVLDGDHWITVVPLRDDRRLLEGENVDMIRLKSPTAPLGLLVKKIQQVGRAALQLEMGTAAADTLGVLNLDGTLVSLIDVGSYLQRYSDLPAPVQSQTQPLVLLWEPAAFRRDLIRTSLTAAGFEVVADNREAPSQALNPSQHRRLFCLILAAGDEVAKAAQKLERACAFWGDLPAIALVPPKVGDLTAYTQKGFMAAVEEDDIQSLPAILQALTPDKKSSEALTA